MEIINVNGYTIEEKVQIGKKYLTTKTIKRARIKTKDLKIAQPQLEKIVEGYTRESGVRGFEKQIAKSGAFCGKKYCHGIG